MKPRLRFNYNENYSYELFKDVFQIKNTNSFSREELKSFGNFKNIHYGDIHTKLNKITNVQSTDLPYIAQENEVKLTELCNDYDVLIADASEDYSDIGKCIQLINVKNCVAGLHTILARPKYKSLYLTHLLSSWYVRKQFMKLACGAKVLGLSKSSLQKVVLPFPKLEEQNKIATFLNLYYKKIELQKKKIEQYKIKFINLFKFLLSKLKLFEVKPLGSLCEITTGKLDANAMVNNGKYKFFTCAKEVYNIDKFAFDTEALLISGNGANVGYIHYFKGKFNAYQRTYILDSFADNIQYIKMYLEINLPKRIKAEKNEGNTPYIVLSTLTEMNILVPAKDIQDRLSECYLLFNQKINLEQQKLELLEKYKHGLLQKMFI